MLSLVLQYKQIIENYIKDPFIKYFIENKNDLKYIHDSYQSEEGVDSIEKKIEQY